MTRSTETGGGKWCRCVCVVLCLYSQLGETVYC